MLEKADHRPGLSPAVTRKTITYRSGSGMVYGFSRADLFLIEQMSQGQRPYGPRISAQEGATIHRE